MQTASFKECEKYSVCARTNSNGDRVMVVASANTAELLRVCSENNIPLLLCVPMDNIQAIWLEKPLNPCVKLVASEGSRLF